MAAATAFAQDAHRVTVIRTKAVVDVENSRLLDGAVIIVRDNKIEAVGPDAHIPLGAEEIDLSDKYVLPGLIDAHTHVTITPDYSSNNPIL